MTFYLQLSALKEAIDKESEHKRELMKLVTNEMHAVIICNLSCNTLICDILSILICDFLSILICDILSAAFCLERSH